MTPLHAAIFGGGRWARELAQVAIQTLPEKSRLYLWSGDNPQSWKNWCNDINPLKDISCHVSESRSDVLANPKISHVLIARSARRHFSTAYAALEAGKCVFVEKPFATNLNDAQVLSELADRVSDAGESPACITGLVFRYGRNLQVFASACSKCGPVRGIDLIWTDPKTEHRYGQEKSYDPSINVVLDVFPHAWSILRYFVRNTPMELTKVVVENGGQKVTLGLALGAVTASTTLVRNAKSRQRMVQVRGAGWSGHMDFSAEPGLASIDGRQVDVSTGFSSPLVGELQAE